MKLIIIILQNIIEKNDVFSLKINKIIKNNDNLELINNNLKLEIENLKLKIDDNTKQLELENENLKLELLKYSK